MRSFDPDQTILPLGDFIPTDDAGFLINPCRRDRIQSAFLSALDAIMQAYLQLVPGRIHSIYLRGSVARGMAIEGISDIDTFALLYDRPSRGELERLAEVERELSARFPVASGVEMILISRQELSKPSVAMTTYKLMISTQCICLWGSDEDLELPRYRPGREILAHLIWLENDLSYCRKQLETADVSELEGLERWICKRLLRAGFELVMEREQRYTRDLFPCYQSFSAHHPTMEPQMKSALRRAITPTMEIDTLQELLSSLGTFILEAYPKAYPPR
jgi:hypothetical protein